MSQPNIQLFEFNEEEADCFDLNLSDDLLREHLKALRTIRRWDWKTNNLLDGIPPSLRIKKII